MGPTKKISSFLKVVKKVPKKSVGKSIKKIDSFKNTFQSKAVKKSISTAAAIQSTKNRADQNASNILKKKIK